MSDYNKDTGGFKKGNPGKPKGAISEKTRIWNEISEWFKGEGLEAYQQELARIKEDDPKEFLKRYETMLEYFAPKLSRTELDANVKQDTTIDPSNLTDEELKQLDNLMSKASE